MMNSPILRSVAYWLSAAGEIASVTTTHIQYVIAHPEKFNIDLGQLRHLYEYYNELWGSEGQARNDTIHQLVIAGWIRIRRYRSHYAINVPTLDDNSRQALIRFADALLNEGIDSRYETDNHIPCHLTEFSNGRQSKITIGQLSDFVLRAE